MDKDHHHQLLGTDSVASPTSVTAPSLWIVEAALEAALPASTRCSKKVRFDDLHNQTFVYAANDFWLEGSNNLLWYSKPELDQIRAHNHQQLKARTADIARARKLGHPTIYEFDEEEDWTWRGLEYVLWKSPRTALRLQHANRLVEWQRGLSKTDVQSELLAALARKSTVQNGCEERARRMGQADQLEARKILGRSKGASFDTTTTWDDSDSEEEGEDDTVSLTSSEESSCTGNRVDVHLVDSIIMSL